MSAPFGVQQDQLGDDQFAVWAPQVGSQDLFMRCPIFEVLLEGTRGGGKTDVLIMDYLQHVGVGWGIEWRGILFRRSKPQLEDVIAKTKRWIPQLYPGAEFNKVEKAWTFPDGEVLLLRHMDDAADYWNYHGHAYPWIGWEELVTWPSPDCYLSMFSCCRSTVPPEARDKFGRPMPRKIRSTCNPWGAGHNWVRRRWRLPEMRGLVIRDSRNDKGDLEPPRLAIFSALSENKILLAAEPNYLQTLTATALNKAMALAWIDGRWDINAGGMFDDLYDAQRHVLPRMHPRDLPSTWRIDRSFDWGSSAPASVGWWAESDGCDLKLPTGRTMSTVRGDVFRINEWYCAKRSETGVVTGMFLTNHDLALGIVKRELQMGLRSPNPAIRSRVKAGPADGSIWNKDRGPSIAAEMAQAVTVDGRRYSGVNWYPADKTKGSRKLGWEAIRSRLKAVNPGEDAPKGPRQKPGLFVFDICQGWIQSVPFLPRDDVDPDDVDTDAEDHCADDTRYRVFTPKQIAKSGRTTGNY